MKKVLLALSLATAFFISGCSSSNEVQKPTEHKTEHKADHSAMSHNSKAKIEKKGFLTTKWCADRGMLKDCRLETVVCGEENCFKKWEFGEKPITELVLFVHNEGTYTLNIDHHSGVHMSHVIEEGLNKNDVTIEGHLNGNSIHVTGIKAPPPAGKSFFKGCL